MNAQFKKGALELCVLSQLALRDQYGYELTENISKEMKLAAGTMWRHILSRQGKDQLESIITSR